MDEGPGIHEATPMALVWTVVLNGLIGLAGWWSARAGFRQPAGLTRLLAAVVVAWTWVTLGMEILGTAGVLGRVPLLAWTATGLGIAAFVRPRRYPEVSLEPGTEPSPGPAWDLEAIVALGLAIWASAFLGLRSMLQPVKVVSDGPIYHLYFAARWWKEGALRLIATPFGETAAPYFPAVGDLWFTWLFTCGGGELLAKVGQAPFLLVAALAAYALARQLGASGSSALVATAWFATSTPLILFSFEANVDTIFVAGYLLAVLFFVRYAQDDPRAATLALGGLAAGGALGAKAVGVVFVPPLLALGAWAVLARRAPRGETLRHLLVLALTPAVMAGFWYGRNAIRTGNPLYPLHLEIGGRVWLAGWFGPDAMRTSQYYLPREDWRAFADLVLAVVDPRMAPFWLAGLLGLWALGKAGERRDRWVWMCSLLAALNVALYWLVVPYRTQQRFMLQAVGLAVVPLARLLDRGRGLRLVAVGILALHLLTSQVWPFGRASCPWDFSPMVPSFAAGPISLEESDLAFQGVRTSFDVIVLLTGVAALGVLSLVAAWRWSRVGQPPTRRGLLLAGLASGSVVALGVALFFPRQLDARSRFYPRFPDYHAGWLDLETRVGPSGARIAYAGTNLPFFLMGSGLRNEVRYITVDNHPTWLLHDYHRESQSQGQPTWPDSRPGWDRLHPDFNAWLANLRAEGIQILVVARANPLEGRFNIADADLFPIERRWADEHPETFELLHGPAQGDRLFRIYRVRPPGPSVNG